MAHISLPFLIIIYLVGAWTLWSAYSLQANYVKAKRMGVPIVVRYVGLSNPIWFIFNNFIIDSCRKMPFGSGQFSRFYARGWAAKDRYKIHAELGDVFVMVTPAGNRLYIANADAANEILRRRKSFHRDTKTVQILNIYGKNVVTASQQEWKTHRRVTVTAFAGTNEIVWKESLKQAGILLQSWLTRTQKAQSNILEDTKVLSLNVLTSAFIANKRMDAKLEKPSFNINDASARYRHALRTMVENLVLIVLFGSKRLQSPWMLPSFRRTGSAVDTFREFVHALVKEEKRYSRTGSGTRPDLVSSLVRACEVEKGHGHLPGSATLTEDEIASNLFVYAVAGMDTTSITLAQAILHLAGKPDIQRWMREELHYYAPHGRIEDVGVDLFSHLKRCQAVMLETLRIFHPVSQLLKLTGDYPETVKVGSKLITLPPSSAVHINMSALHTNPEYWGPDAMVWNPRRWISSPPSDEPQISKEELAPDTSSSFIPWATDTLVCPGKRFSQIEFVGIMAALFHRHEVKPKAKEGETLEDAQKRTIEVAEDTQNKFLLQEIRQPEKAGLIWTEG